MRVLHEHQPILTPRDVRRGAVGPGGVIARASLYENPGAGALVASLVYTNGQADIITWPLATGWKRRDGSDAGTPLGPVKHRRGRRSGWLPFKRRRVQ